MKINLGNGANFFWNPGILAKSIDAQFREIVDDLGEEFKEVIEDKSAFPEFSGEDIIDSGELLKNQKLNIIKSGEANYEWGVAYAIYVHEGYTKKNGQMHPGRPWTQEAIRRYNNRKKI